jgi:hypothetical protein
MPEHKTPSRKSKVVVSPNHQGTEGHKQRCNQRPIGAKTK